MIRATGYARLATWVVVLGQIWMCTLARADQAGAATSSGQAERQKQEKAGDAQAEALVRVSKDHNVWIDRKRKRVVIDGKVCLRGGQLEMFACLKNTKEHESIVAVDTQAYVVHAALLAIGAQVGHPVQFNPKYVPASGTEIDVLVLWTGDEGKQHKNRAQDWVRQVNTGRAIQFPWVFAGSGFWVDEQTGQRHYHAEGGDFICVSNFPSAMLDLPVKSTQANADLLFDAFTERIPPIGTPVRLVLIPKLDQDDGSDKSNASQ